VLQPKPEAFAKKATTKFPAGQRQPGPKRGATCGIQSKPRALRPPESAHPISIDSAWNIRQPITRQEGQQSRHGCARNPVQAIAERSRSGPQATARSARRSWAARCSSAAGPSGASGAGFNLLEAVDLLPASFHPWFCCLALIERHRSLSSSLKALFVDLQNPKAGGSSLMVPRRSAEAGRLACKFQGEPQIAYSPGLAIEPPRWPDSGGVSSRRRCNNLPSFAARAGHWIPGRSIKL